MTEVYFHCSNDSHELIDGSGTIVNDLSEASRTPTVSCAPC